MRRPQSRLDEDINMSAESASIFPAERWRHVQRGNPLDIGRIESRVMVALSRKSDARGCRDRFVCDIATWSLLLEVAVVFGWKQRGTTYLRTGALRHTKSSGDLPMTRHDYVPGDPRDPKYVDGVDAMAWSLALSSGRRSPYLSRMLVTPNEAGAKRFRAGSSATGAPFTILLDEFSRYAFGGSFSFSKSEG